MDEDDVHAGLIGRLYGNLPMLPSIPSTAGREEAPAPAPTAPSPITTKDASTQVNRYRSRASLNPYTQLRDNSYRMVNQLIHRGDYDNSIHRDFQEAVEGVIDDRMAIEHPDPDDEVTSHLQDVVIPAIQQNQAPSHYAGIHRPTPRLSASHYEPAPIQAPQQNTDVPEMGGDSSHFRTIN